MQSRETASFDVTPKPKTDEPGGSRVRIAGKYLVSREASQEEMQKAKGKLTDLEELILKPKTWEVFKKVKQKRALKSWLADHGYLSHKHAKNEIEYANDRAQKSHEQFSSELDIWMPEVRESLTSYDPERQKNLDTLLRKCGLPGELVAACDQQYAGQDKEPNLVEWLSHAPDDDEDFGASDEQLEQALMWNISKTEHLAKESDVSQTVANYLDRLRANADQGTLDQKWADALPKIDSITVGDIFDPYLTTRGETVSRGAYSIANRELMIWPYEVDEAEDERYVPLNYIIDHEVTHSIGGFNSLWLDEGFTERIASINDGRDPGDLDNTAYTVERAVIDTMMKGAPRPLTDKNVSSVYIGQDRTQNERKLNNLVKEAYDGLDVLTALNESYAAGKDQSLVLAAQHIADIVRFRSKTPESVIVKLLDHMVLKTDNPAEKIALEKIAEMFRRYKPSTAKTSN